MMAIIKAQTDALTEKIEVVQHNVKSDIKNAVDPLIVRQDNLEAKTTKQYEDMTKQYQDMTKQYEDMTKQITHIKESMVHPEPQPIPNPLTLPSAAPTYAQSVVAGSHATTTSHRTIPPPAPQPSPSDGSFMGIIHKAERTIGFQPIYASDIDDICRIHSTNDTNEAMKLLVIEFLRFEMKNSVTKLENIVCVFPPAKPDWNTLYAEFDTKSAAQTVYHFTKYLRDRHHKVTMYVPHLFYDQFNHLSSLAYKYRLPPNVHKTRVKFGNKDMFLQVKPPGGQAWKVVHVPDLPPLTLQASSPDISVSPSPAPGRARLSSTKRCALSPIDDRHPKVPRPNLTPNSPSDIGEHAMEASEDGEDAPSVGAAGQSVIRERFLTFSDHELATLSPVNKQSRSYICNQCKVAFATQYHLTIHLCCPSPSRVGSQNTTIITDMIGSTPCPLSPIPQLDGPLSPPGSPSLSTLSPLCTAPLTIPPPPRSQGSSFPPGQTSQNKRPVNYSLDRKKQLNRLTKDAKIDDFEISVSPVAHNVTIKCSAGFYSQVVLETFANMSLQYRNQVDGVSIQCCKTEERVDTSGAIVGVLITFDLNYLNKQRREFIGTVQVHLHHTTRRVQLQGSSLVHDKVRAPVWFVDSFLKGVFNHVANLKAVNITSFNNAVLNVLTAHIQKISGQSKCGVCVSLLGKRSIPEHCLTCNNLFP